MNGRLHMCFDGGHGSSGKGATSTRLAEILNLRNASACCAPNAGHTAVVDGTKFVAHVLPTSAILKKVRNRDFKIWLGAGTSFVPKQLYKELEETGYQDGDSDFIVHARAGVVEQRHIDMESPGGAWSTEWLSSTMTGSGANYAEKVMRRQEYQSAQDVLKSTLQPMEFARAIRAEMRAGGSFIHEVSQGFALSLNWGTTWKQSTFRDCTVQQSLNDLGITPEFVGDIFGNYRSLPIRVGSNFRDGKQTGYAGDFMPDQTELTWTQVAEMAEMPPQMAAELAEKERTTCTHKIRRVATFSDQLLKDSVEFCGATKLCLNFVHYIHASAFGETNFNKLHPRVRAFVDHMEDVAQLPVVLLGTGPEHHQFIWRG